MKYDNLNLRIPSFFMCLIITSHNNSFVWLGNCVYFKGISINMRYSIILFFFYTLQWQSLQAQNAPYARIVVDTLAGQSMKGRGYVDNGVGKAAGYIAKEFDRLGLKKLSKNYFQEFKSPVNTFPGRMELEINGISLIPGQDFLIEPGSPEISGTYETLTLTYDDLLDKQIWIPKVRSAKGKFLIIDERDTVSRTDDDIKLINELVGFFRYHPDNPAVGTITLTDNKLTWAGATRLLSHAGFTINSDKLTNGITSVRVDVQNQFYENYDMKNVIGLIEGQNKDAIILLSAHYDHLGMMGMSTIFPGANDNASGVAMLLNLAEYYVRNKPEYSIVFIAFAGEELGLLGSKYYTENPLFPLDQIKFMINFDIAGTGDEGIQIVNGSVFKAKFDLIKNLNEEAELLPQIKIRGEACNSDHCLFYQKGVPSFFIYTLGGIQAYHDIHDKPDTLPLTAFESYFKLIISFVGILD